MVGKRAQGGHEGELDVVAFQRVKPLYHAWVRLHEKGGKQHEVPTNHNLDEYLEAYIKELGRVIRPEAGR